MSLFNAIRRVANPIRAYHGSPHDFDQFSMAHIGRGEGAQAYGHGLYFAEAEDVARGYRARLGGKGLPLGEVVAQHLEEAPSQGVLAKIYSEAVNGHQDLERAARAVQMAARELRDDGASFVGPLGDRGRRIAAAIADIRDRNRGRMYEVGIHASPDEFLDWDAPLSAQSERARAALAPLLEQGRRGVLAKALEPDDPDVGRILAAARFEGGPANRPEEALRSAGIPGIRYLDQGSRSAGEGSRNYVVFDDSLIEILRKYGLPGMIGGGGMLGALSRAQQEQAA